MRFQRQRYIGSAPGGAGDCHRTCVAMILNMDRDAVPHFMADCHPSMTMEHPAMVAAARAEVEWLAERGLAPVHVGFPGEMMIVDLLEQLRTLANGAPVVLGCSVNRFTSSGTGSDHSVVIHEGRIHNPNPSTRITGPMLDGVWWLTIYSVGPNWRSPRLGDQVRSLARQFTCWLRGDRLGSTT